MTKTLPKPGQWFDTGPATTYGFAGPPKFCISVSKNRVYFRRSAYCATITADTTPERQQAILKLYEERKAEIDAAPPEYCSGSSVGVDHAHAGTAPSPVRLEHDPATGDRRRDQGRTPVF